MPHHIYKHAILIMVTKNLMYLLTITVYFWTVKRISHTAEFIQIDDEGLSNILRSCTNFLMFFNPNTGWMTLLFLDLK